MIVINCTGSDTLELDELADFQGALKQRSAADINKIIKSIKKHGFSFPFFVWAHDDINHVLDGHGRLAALKKMQADGEEIPALPCVYVEAENEAEAKEKLLKLNSQYGHMTAESVADFLDGMEIELDDLALPDGVLDLSGIAAPEEETEGDDDAPDVDEDGEPDSKPGEMYELGNSILLCGDSTNPEDVARILGGLKADLVFTDPPYGMKKESDGVANDNLNYDDLLEFNKKRLALLLGHRRAAHGYLQLHLKTESPRGRDNFPKSHNMGQGQRTRAELRRIPNVCNRRREMLVCYERAAELRARLVNMV